MSKVEAHSGGIRSRRGIAALAALLALVPIIAGIVITSGSVRAHPAGGLAFSPAGGSQATPAPLHRGNNLPAGSGALVALLSRPTTMRVGPGGPALGHLSMKTSFGSPQVMWVTKLHGPWLGVVSTLSGNNRIGWIPRSSATLGRVPWELKVSLSARRLRILYAGKLIRSYTVAVGASGSPTPSGRFAVTDRLYTGDSSGPYGCCILALSATSPHAIQGWSGGYRIAIHSTTATSSIGLPVSHGCVRVTLADGRWLLAHIPLGTPTLISS